MQNLLAVHYMRQQPNRCYLNKMTQTAIIIETTWLNVWSVRNATVKIVAHITEKRKKEEERDDNFAIITETRYDRMRGVQEV